MKSKLIIALIVLFSVNQLFAEVKVARIFNNNMVLQRNKDVPVWGWADKDEKVTVVFNGQKAVAKTDLSGKWMVKLKPMKEGGPLEMTVKGKNTIVLKNILIGEVWVCSGQSNMSFKVSDALNASEDIANANYPSIRCFTVPSKFTAKPLTDFGGGDWKICSPATVGRFTAVGYFFARELYKSLNVPVGFIQTSWGGTNAETWTSSETIQVDDDFKGKLAALNKIDLDSVLGHLTAQKKEWTLNMETNEPGKKEKWELLETDVSSWKEMKLPTFWENAGLPGLDGVVWFRKDIELTKAESEAGMTLNLGPIDDGDDTYVNGMLVGQLNYLTANAGITPRVYKVDSKLLKEGKNTIVIRVMDKAAQGGFGAKADDFYAAIAGVRKSLVGDWIYRIGFQGVAPAYPGPDLYPTTLYNGMIHALIPFAIQGVAWYQGENNASRAYQYRSVFPRLITDWRTHWGQGDFPFLFVQLANYQPAKDQPGESNWAELREAQTMTLSLPNTGMALAIDLGEALNIHPKNKQDVGARLALAARKVAYHQDLIYSGPTFDALKIENGKITVSFKNTGSGLITKDKYNYVKGFAIAGDDKKFYWAKAVIDGTSVTVSSDKVPNPVAVRYAWADNPDDANLYNKENLPAVPFRTDSWDGQTKGRK